MKHALIAAISTVLVLTAEAGANAAITWSTAVDHASTSTNQMRSVAVSQQQGNESVYVGFIQTSPNGRDVYRYDATSPYALLDTRGTSAAQPKGIATDDRGYVYVGNREGSGSYEAIIAIHENDLDVAAASFNASTNAFGGVATWKNGGNYYLYISREVDGIINRYDITDLNNITLDTSFGTGGTFTIANGGKLRGLEVAADGTIYVANRDTNTLYRVSADLQSTTSATVTKAMDVALFGGKAYVTSYNGANSLISVLDAATLAWQENHAIATLDGNPYSRGANEGWAGIDIGADGRIWLTDQHYGSVGGTQDRLLVSSPVPEPGTLALLVAAGLGAFCYAWRRRKAAK